MKKILILGLVFGVILSYCSITPVKAETVQKANNQVVKEAIKKYKEKNYLGCISDLKQYTEQNPSNAVAWYYLGSAYMNVALQQEAFEAFDKVKELDTVPRLTSYAIQAELCMQNSVNCEYKEFDSEDIQRLKLNPIAFFQELADKQKGPEKTPQTLEVEKLINGEYPGNIHPDAADFIREEGLRVQQSEMNK